MDDGKAEVQQVNEALKLVQKLDGTSGPHEIQGLRLNGQKYMVLRTNTDPATSHKTLYCKKVTNGTSFQGRD